MPCDLEFSDDVVIAAATACPMLDCGTLVVAYRSTDSAEHDDAQPWEFTCPRCGFEFVVPEEDLIFQSVPKDWLLAKVHAA